MGNKILAHKRKLSTSTILLISPNPEIALPEALISLLSIVTITALSILLSFLVIKRKRSEYRE